MAVVEPVVNLEKLRQLLDEGHESENLDYKATIGFEPGPKIATGDMLAITKDIAAMQIDGGFIILGADDQGNPTDAITLPVDEVRNCFDESRLRSQLKRYISEPFDIRSAVHQIDGKMLIILFVAPRSDGFCVFSSEGNHNGRSVFRKGEVYARHGSASEPWQQQDIQRIIEKLVTARKEEWRTELRDEWVTMSNGSAAQQIARGPASAVSWKLDEATLVNTTIELLRSNDDIPLRLLMNGAATDAARLADTQGASGDDVNTVLDRIMCLAALTATLERSVWFQAAIKALARVYSSGFDERGYARQLKGMPTEQLWLCIVERVMALGALLVRLERWDDIRQLVFRPRPDGDSERYPSWIRHGTTMAARSGLLIRDEGDRRLELSLLSLAREHAIKHECLHPDVTPDSELIMDSLCQFDFLAGVTAIGDMGTADSRAFYTSFARFYSSRTEPIVVRLIDDPEMRNKLFPHNDRSLALALAEMIRAANYEGFRYTAWGGFDNPAIGRFLASHLTEDERLRLA